MIKKTKMKLNIKYFLYVVLSVFVPTKTRLKYKDLYRNARHCGNTTRLIDMFVQELFDTGKCQIYDHYNTSSSKDRVMYLVLQRLNREHGIEKKTS